MKKVVKRIVVSTLSWQVRRLQKRHDFRTVAVVGGIGKTSTKTAIATMLGSKYRVRFQSGNYNDIVTVPLVYFGEQLPSLFNVFSWLRLLVRNEFQIRGDYLYDFVVLELGTDGPGQIKQFASFVEADIAIVTAITPEHMEYFGGLEDVALEELSVASFSRTLLVNSRLCSEVFIAGIECERYGEDVGSDLWQYSVQAAKAVGKYFDMSPQEIDDASKLIKPTLGRMNRLSGINNSIIIDDTYNSSPDAVFAALDLLKDQKSSYKIAILGSMNELGVDSEKFHRQAGGMCSPDWLDSVITIGSQANNYIASSARQNGCSVTEFTNPRLAGEYVKSILKPGAVVLAKGSQNGVFAEEAIKVLLDNPDDAKYLVRQSEYWMDKKKELLASET